MRCACRFFPHQSDQTSYLTAIALDDRAEFGALGDGHADALDNDIIDLVTAIVVNQPPVDPERRRVAGLVTSVATMAPSPSPRLPRILKVSPPKLASRAV